MTSLCRPLEIVAGLGRILRHAKAAEIKLPQRIDAFDIAEVGGPHEPLARIEVVLRHALPARVHAAEFDHACFVTGVGGAAEPIDGGAEILRHAEARLMDPAEPAHGIAAPSLCRRLEQRQRAGMIDRDAVARDMTDGLAERFVGAAGDLFATALGVDAVLCPAGLVAVSTCCLLPPRRGRRGVRLP